MEKERGAGEKKAAALKYDPGRDRAPRVLAAGTGEVAARIIREAEEHGVPIYEDAALAAALVRLPVGGEIPPELYLAVAEVLSYIYRLDRKRVSSSCSSPSSTLGRG